MSTTTAANPTTRGLPANEGTLAQRILRGAVTPGGAVFVLLAVLFVAVVLSNPSFGEPPQLIRFIGQDEGRVLPAIALMLLVGAAVGVVNGLATTLLKVPSFIVTLGTMLALGGLVDYLTGGAATGNPVDTFRELGRGGIEGVPVVDVLPFSVIILVVVGAAGVLLMRSPFGRTLIATGDNPDAAGLAGASVWWVKTRAFVLSSLSATVAGILLVGYAGVHPSVGQGYEFQAITAVVLGGVVLGGGRGWLLSAAAGAFALELLFAFLNFREVESTWRDTVQGLIIILAVAVAGRAWTVGRSPKQPPDPPPQQHDRPDTATAATTNPAQPGTDTGEH